MSENQKQIFDENAAVAKQGVRKNINNAQTKKHNRGNMFRTNNVNKHNVFKVLDPNRQTSSGFFEASDQNL